MFCRASLAVLASAVLVACGGGGGGKVTFSVSTNHIVKTDTLADYNPPQGVLTATLSGDAGQVYIGFQQTGNAIGAVYFDSYEPTSATVYVPFRQFMPAGIYQDTVVIHVCHDAACNKPLEGSPQTINVTYNHLEGGDFSSMPQAIEVTAIEGVAPEVPPIDLAYSGGGVESWTATIEYGSGSDWLSLDNAGGPADFLPQYVNPTVAPILPPGTYTADVVFTSNGGTVTHTVPVTYHVAVPRSSPTTLSFAADLNSTPATLTQPLGLLAAFNDVGASSSAWTATANVPWLQVTAAGGSAEGAELTVSVIPAGLPELDYGEHAAVITIQGESGISTLEVPVSLAVLLPRVQYAAPYVLSPGREGDLILRGRGFDAADGLTLEIGDTEIQDYAVVDDTRLELHHGGFAAGTHAVSLRDQFGGNTNLGRVVVKGPIPAGQYPVQNIDDGTDGQIHQTVFDHGRWARFHLVYYQYGYYAEGSWRLVAERFDGVEWTNAFVEIPELSWIALTPDGRELLLAGSSGRQIQHWDPDTLEIVATTPLAERDPFRVGLGPIFNDGRMVAFGYDPVACGFGCAPEVEETARHYDIRARRFEDIPPNVVKRGEWLQTPTLDNAIVIGGSETRLIAQDFSVLASLPQAIEPSYILGMGDAPKRLILYNDGMETIENGTFNWQTISIYGERSVLMAPDDRYAYYYRDNHSTIRVRDMTQPEFPMVAEFVVPFSSWWKGMLSADGTHIYHLTSPFTSVAVP